jgi:DNA recombination protein RmuC
MLEIALTFVFLLVGIFIGKLIFGNQNQNALAAKDQEIAFTKEQWQKDLKQIQVLQNQLEALTQSNTNFQIQLATKTKEVEGLLQKLAEQKQEVEQLQEKFTKEFEILAQKILEEKSQKFSAQNKEQIQTILEPLQNKIVQFEKKVEDTHKESIGQHSALRQQIMDLKLMNEQISKEALNLTKALKGDTKMQGNWGEMILERVLEKSGLEKGREYEVQTSYQNQNGQRVQPDVIIHLPDKKQLIVDSKVSLVAYEKWVNEADEATKEILLKEHIGSIKRHVDQLSSKSYQSIPGLQTPDFVLLFIPIEAAFAIALNFDNSLYNKAFEQNIVIVTPTTLLATLRTINSMWTNQKQQENALEIARLAGSMYDKFEGLVQDLMQVGKRIQEADTAYKASMNKLVDGRGNVVNTIEKIKKMGAKATKSLPDKLINRASEEELDN